jgi:peptide/nickel transport system substrate-binding protein
MSVDADWLDKVVRGPLSRRDLLVRSGMAASLVAVGAPLLAGCSSDSDAEDAQATGSIGVGMANAFVGFDPALSPQLGSIAVIRNVFEALMRFDAETNGYTPWLLAGEPERTAANTFSAQIRRGAKFHDGAPVTAEDVAWTFEYYKDPETASFFSTFLQTIETIEGQGSDLTITVTEELPNFHFALSIPMIMPRAAFESAGAEAFSASPVGSGPFRFESQTPGQSVRLRRFDGYSGPEEADLDRIEMKYFVEDASRIAQLTGGQLDVIDGVPYRDLEAVTRGDIESGVQDGGRYTLIETNQFKGPFKDERVRQAFLYGLDREALIEAVFPGGNALVADSQLPPEHPYFVEPSIVYRHDPERAKSLMADAGYADGLEFELLVSTIPWVSQLGTLVKEQLDAIGMTSTIRLTETEAGYGIVATKNYDVYLAYGNWYALGRYADVTYRAFNYGAGRDGFYGKVAGRDAEYDKLVDAAFSQTTEQAQIDGYAAVQELFSKSILNNYAVFWPKVTGAWRAPVTGYQVPADDIPSMVGVSA